MTANDHLWLRRLGLGASRPVSRRSSARRSRSWRSRGTWCLDSFWILTDSDAFVTDRSLFAVFPSTPNSLRLSRFDGPKALDDLPAPAMPSQASRTVSTLIPLTHPKVREAF